MIPESATSAQNLRELEALIGELAPLRQMYPEATKGAIKGLAKQCWILEHVGATCFGDGRPRPDVLAWHMVDQARRRRWSWLQLQSYLAQLRAERIRRV